jgi:hypothetical protein
VGHDTLVPIGQAMSEQDQAHIGVLLGGGAMKHKTTGEMAYHFGMLDLDAAEKVPASFDLGFLAHGVTQSPHDPRRFVLFEKHGPGCCVVDVVAREIVETIVAAPRRQFYGHGVFSRDGALLYCTETDVHDKLRGYIAVRDAHDFRLLGDFPSFGLAPHDCMLTGDGGTLVVTNGGSRVGEPEPPCVVWVDVASQSLRELREIPDPMLNAGHLAMTDQGDVAIVSAPREGVDAEHSRGGVSLLPRGGAFTTAREPRELTDAMLGETLSVAIHAPTRIVGATTPLADLVSFWHLDTGALVKKLRVPNPRGIALSLDGTRFVICFGAPPRAACVEAATLVPSDEPGNQRGHLSLVTGSHITMVDRENFAAV